MSLRIKAIQSLIHLNEKLIFYPRLKKFYIKNLTAKAPVVVDVGSNKGQTIDFFKQYYPDCVVYGFEPNKRLYHFLHRKYHADSSVRLWNAGISNTTGTLMFKETITDETSTLEELNYQSNYLKKKSTILGVRPEGVIKKTYEVNVIMLANFLKKENIKHIDVLKIDAEGHELKCLDGLFRPELQTSISYIQLEQHDDDMYMSHDDIMKIPPLMKRNNFTVCETLNHGFGDFKEVIYKATF